MGGFIWLAFRALPWLAQAGVIVAIFAALLTTYGVWHHKVYMNGWRDHEAAIVREDKKSIDSALAKRAIRADCLARGLRWDVITGKCEGR